MHHSTGQGASLPAGGIVRRALLVMDDLALQLTGEVSQFVKDMPLVLDDIVGRLESLGVGAAGAAAGAVLEA